MKKLYFLLICFIWILALFILIIAITDVYPDNLFKKYKFIVGIGFISLTGFLKIIYNRIFPAV
ncbi:MAG: hypothetical protein ACI9XR_001179 [Flavobacterium sp.]|jgi:hypothetical protein